MSFFSSGADSTCDLALRKADFGATCGQHLRGGQLSSASDSTKSAADAILTESSLSNFVAGLESLRYKWNGDGCYWSCYRFCGRCCAKKTSRPADEVDAEELLSINVRNDVVQNNN